MTSGRRAPARAARGSGRRRRTTWLGASVTTNNLISGSFATAGILDVRMAANAYAVGGTVSVIHGELGVRNDTFTTDVGLVSMGVIVVEGEAFDAASGVPDPAVDISASWLWHADICTNGGGDNISAYGTRFVPVLGRSKRKLRGNDVLVYVVKNAGVQAIDSRWTVRYLLLLP